jgi:thiol-disulfide isomerase/thioredoxin
MCLIGCASQPPPTTPAPASSPSPLTGKSAPDFGRTALDGARFDLVESRGHVTVVKFVAKYCVPCQRTLPAMERLHREHPDVVIVAIAEDDTEDDARQLIAAHHLTFPVIHDRGNALSGRYRVTDLPITFVLDKSGVVTWVGGPDRTESELTAAILAKR